MIRISIFFNNEIYKKVKTLAKKYKLSSSLIIRVATECFIDSQDLDARLKQIAGYKKLFGGLKK